MELINHRTLYAFLKSVFEAAGCAPGEADAIAGHLADSNVVGHDSHGAIRTRSYLTWLKEGKVLANRSPEILFDCGAYLSIDGNFGFGQVMAREATYMGVERARRNGICSVALRNAGHIGRVGAWAELAAGEGVVSLHFVNTSGFALLVAPHGGRDRRLSANPIVAGIPVPGCDPVIVDMATSTVAEGKIMVAINKGELLPEGAIIDGNGRPTRDPNAFYADPPGAILPFGGHKGSALSVLCEIFAGVLTGGGTTHPQRPTAGRLVNNMFSLFIDPIAFKIDDYAADVLQFTAWVKSSRPLEEGGVVLLPGEIERRTREQRMREGIPMDDNTLSMLNTVAADLGLDTRL